MEQFALQESLQNNNKSTATVLNKDMQPTHLCVCHLFSIYQTYGKFIFCTTQSVSRVFMQFSIVLNRLLFEIKIKEKVAEVE